MNPFVESQKVVWENPRYVFINERALEDLACKMANDNLPAPTWRDKYGIYPEDDDVMVEFLGMTNAINFCFTDFKTDKKFDAEYPVGSGKIHKGAFAMAACVRRAMDEGLPILKYDWLTDLKEEQAAHIFRCHLTAISMLKDRVLNLRNVGCVLCHNTARFKSFKELFEACDYRLFNNGRGFLEVLPRWFSSYQDACLWNNGRNLLQFQKRAQLFALMYQGRALSSGGRLPLLRDPEKIGPIADYQVARALRFLKVITYHLDLAQMVDSGKVIEKNSRMEIEIRAIGVTQVVCQLLERINVLRKELGKTPITMAELDFALWTAGRNVSQRHHYTYTMAY